MGQLYVGKFFKLIIDTSFNTQLTSYLMENHFLQCYTFYMLLCFVRCVKIWLL